MKKTLVVIALATLAGCHHPHKPIRPAGPIAKIEHVCYTSGGSAVVGGDSFSPGHQPDVLGKPGPRGVVIGSSYSPGFQPDLDTILDSGW